MNRAKELSTTHSPSEGGIRSSCSWSYGRKLYDILRSRRSGKADVTSSYICLPLCTILFRVCRTGSTTKKSVRSLRGRRSARSLVIFVPLVSWCEKETTFALHETPQGWCSSVVNEWCSCLSG